MSDMSNENTAAAVDTFALASLFSLGVALRGKGPARLVRRLAVGPYVMIATTSTECTAHVECYSIDRDGLEIFIGTIGELLLAEPHLGGRLVYEWMWERLERARERDERAQMNARCALGAA